MADEPKTRRIRIIHDGSMQPMKSRIVDAETGEQLRYVRRVELTFDASSTVEAVIYMVAPEVEVEVDATVRYVAPFDPLLPVGGLPK